jgi:hypothetical protein
MHIIEDNEQDIPSLRKANAQLFNTVLRLQAQYGVMVKERDAVRRELCMFAAFCQPSVTAQELATMRGWNCFDKENGNES